MTRTPTAVIVLFCCSAWLGGCGGDEGTTSVGSAPELGPAALPDGPPAVLEDAVEFVALVEAEAWVTYFPDDFPNPPEPLWQYNLHNEAIEVRFYRLDAPASAAKLIAASGIDDRNCTEYPLFPDDPWTIYTHLPTETMRPVDAGEALTLVTPEGSWTELVRQEGGIDGSDDRPYVSFTRTARPSQPQEIDLHRVELNVPGGEFPPLDPIRLPTRWPDMSSGIVTPDLSTCLDCVGDRIFVGADLAFISAMRGEPYGQSQKSVALNWRYLPFDPSTGYQIGPGAAVCRGDDLDPLLFDREAAADLEDTFANYWMGHVGTTTERRGNVLVLTSYVANKGPHPGPSRIYAPRE